MSKRNGKEDNINKTQQINVNISPEKEFKPRNSLLTDMYKTPHINSIHNCFIAVMIITIMNTFICEMLASGSIESCFRFIIVGFGQIHKALIIWIVMFGSTLFVYPVFCLWAKTRLNLHPKSLFLRLWDRVWLILFLTYFAAFFYLPPYGKGHGLPIASSAIILGEQIRMLMKTHAFIRSNVPAVQEYKPHSEKTIPIPKFSEYLYFLFIPTFVYRKEYPRTKEIRWWFVALNFTEFAVGIYFYSFLTANYLVPDFKNIGLEPYNWRTMAAKIFRMIFPSSLIMLMGFYMILHSWLNVWAEMLRFADRLFYLDWWNTTSYSAYYRKWNIVIHDYLHAYIYRDMYEIILPGNKVAATCTVFLMSALVHEYVVALMLGFFFPVLFVQFVTFGTILTFIKLKNNHFIGNVFLWWSLSMGIGIQISLYTMEYYARINCPIENEGFSDFFIPRLLICNKVEN